MYVAVFLIPTVNTKDENHRSSIFKIFGKKVKRKIS